MERIDAYYLYEKPDMPGRYIINNNFDVIRFPKGGASLRLLEARLIGMTYTEYLTFCEECLGAIINKPKGHKYAGIYFEKIPVVEKFIELLNRKFWESYELYEE